MIKKNHFDIARHISWQNTSNKLITKTLLAQQIGVCVRTIDNWIKSSFLPAPIMRNGRIIGWLEGTLYQWFNHIKTYYLPGCIA
ncbi:hypothetical protein C9J21_18815 [Photobacterium phosphoreum]|uniref:helix-turn-helix transcriptional regulator n=1 Tax=Photobacterium phosphoreum TaxID=659 RepID=UPI000D16BF9F|nr:hypothetical protein [Photobacterium phosphoreum]PSW30448.1 hypothetical protein C9J21_18815 [Photobacterium phosphoreum]